MSPVMNGKDSERNELEWLLKSGVLGRSQNLTRMLQFICEKHFEGRPDEVSESSVAVEALGRRSDFDPQTDTIVRVTTHTLRKRLQKIYLGEGAAHPVHILIPPGQYAPSFLHGAASGEEGMAAAGAASLFRRGWLVATLLVVIAAAAGGYFAFQNWRSRPSAARGANLNQVSAIMGHPLRALLGSGRKPYVDHSGYTWSPGNYCQGGASMAEPNQAIIGTEDPYIFLGGVRGNTHCVFHVDPGIYEVHLLFAELSHLEAATSRAVVFLNGSEGNTIDVVDEAMGNGIATARIFSGVRPQNDGAIHVDYVSEVSALKSVEILPAPTEAMLPVRIVAGARSYTDPAGEVWLSDRYFIGGRPGMQPAGYKEGEPNLYSDHRVGRFRYIIPVIPLKKYRVRLYFQEPWFGKQNGGTGGSNSRVFDVWCNGSMLLRSFDIIAEGGSAPIVKTFDNLQSTAQGKIELDFVPVVNYALISAIEVIPEPAL